MNIPPLPFECTLLSTLEGKKLEELAQRLGEIDGAVEISPSTTKASRFILPFYRGVTLLELSDEQWVPKHARLCFLEHGNNLYRLDGTSPPIHKVNAKAGVDLNESSALAYLVFFCFFVRGEEGPFFIIDQTDSPYLPDDLPSEMLESHFRQPKMHGEDKDGKLRASALVYYSNALFVSNFLIHPSGTIEMIEDTPIVDDLPSKIDAPLTFDPKPNAKE